MAKKAKRSLDVIWEGYEKQDKVVHFVSVKNLAASATS